MSNLNFTDVFLSLLPSGSLWNLSEAIHTLDEIEIAPVILNGSTMTAPGTWAPFQPETGDLIVVSGSTLNDGTYTVAADWDATTPAVITVAETFVLEAVGAGIYYRQIKAGDLKRMLTACGDNHQEMRDYLRTLADLRDPQTTTMLSDLEKEYGLKTNTGLTEQQRRDRLDAIVYAPAGTGSASYLQANLQAGGFDVYVYQNSPVTDPGAFYGGPGGELIVNPENYNRTIEEARLEQKLWPFVFFIGGTAYRDASGKIVHIEPVAISDALKPSFREIVLQCKPVHSWALCVVNEEHYFTFSDDDTCPTDTDMGFASEDGTTGGFWYEEGDDFDPPWVQVLLDADGNVVIDDETGAALIDG